MHISLPLLPFAKTALEPYMSKETLEIHYGRHHKGYVDKINKLAAGTEFEGLDLDEIVVKAQGPIFDNAAQAWNHTFFWSCMGAARGEKPGPKMSALIKSTYGSIANFKAEFSTKAESLFGSGWVWLVQKDDQTLEIQALPNAGSPLTSGLKPLLVMDVWEHAYYIDYRNERNEFIKAFWNVTNWHFVEQQSELPSCCAKQGHLKRSDRDGNEVRA